MAPYEHNLLPFSTPQSYALLSAESKATDAANNKEKLDVYHDMCGAVPFFQTRRVVALRLAKVVGVLPLRTTNSLEDTQLLMDC